MLPPALAAGPTCNSVKSRTPFCSYLLPGPRGFTTAFCHRASAAAPVRRSPLFPLTWWGGGLTKIVPCPSLRVPADRARTPFIRPCVLPRVRSKPWSLGDTMARHTTCCHMGTIAARLLASGVTLPVFHVWKLSPEGGPPRRRSRPSDPAALLRAAQCGRRGGSDPPPAGRFLAAWGPKRPENDSCPCKALWTSSSKGPFSLPRGAQSLSRAARNGAAGTVFCFRL